MPSQVVSHLLSHRALRSIQAKAQVNIPLSPCSMSISHNTIDVVVTFLAGKSKSPFFLSNQLIELTAIASKKVAQRSVPTVTSLSFHLPRTALRSLRLINYGQGQQVYFPRSPSKVILY